MSADQKVRHDMLSPMDGGLARRTANLEFPVATLRTLDCSASPLRILVPGSTGLSKSRQVEVRQSDAEIAQEVIEVIVSVKLCGELGVHDRADHDLSSLNGGGDQID